MAILYGKTYTRRELEARVGSMKQLADLRAAEMTGGREAGTKILELTNGVLSATVVPGRCLDVANFTYRGIPLNFTGKCGVVYAGLAEPVENPLRSVNGGMFYTCGLSNVGNAYGDDYFHGRVRLIPAEQLSTFAGWEGDEYVLRCSGIMRECSVCGDNLSLERHIETTLGSREIRVSDTVCNDGFRPAPFMMMYHLVFGFPLLDAESRLYLPVAPGELGEKTCFAAAPTPDGIDNGGGLFRALANDEGFSTYCMYNPTLGVGLEVSFDARPMPYLSQWKSMQSGDYAMGLMPTNCKAGGRQREIDGGTLRHLAGGEVVKTSLTLRAIEGEGELAETLAKIENCKNTVE